MILLELFSQRSRHILHNLHQTSSIKNRLRCISTPKSWSHIKNSVVLTFRHIQCLHLVYAEVAWVLVSSGTQVQPQIILDQYYLPDYPSVSYDYAFITLDSHIRFWKIIRACDVLSPSVKFSSLYHKNEMVLLV